MKTPGTATSTLETKMANVGGIDRILRFALGIVLIALPLATSLLDGWGAWKYASLVVGIVMFSTALFRFCPAYTLLGIRTCPLLKT